MLLNLLQQKNISHSAINAMASTALEFSDDVVKRTNPILVDIFERIERGESTHEEEIQKLFNNYYQHGTIHV